MRLVNKKTRELGWFTDDKTPPYIILSHRWIGAETSLQEFLLQRDLTDEHWSQGTAKVMRLCQEALSYPEDYVWIDSCCIDKASSTELQEAINSMYKWYENAATCIAYLEDVSLAAASTSSGSIEDQLAKSAWFNRGWTLQEMLAPKKMVFVDCEWKALGDRNALSENLETITGVQKSFYGDRSAIMSATVAERMSWLSQRKTARVEDLAYCMLGIFDVNMNMLYGEGAKAFLRLQKEIIQEIDDESIFVWLNPSPFQPWESTALAPGPECFSACRDLKIRKDVWIEREPYRMTTKGLEIELYDRRSLQFHVNSLTLILNCTINGQRAYVPIIRAPQSPGVVNQWRRKDITELGSLEDGTYHSPPSAKEEYEKQLRGMRNYKPPSMTKSTGFEHFDFANENVRFKVFIK